MNVITTCNKCLTFEFDSCIIITSITNTGVEIMWYTVLNKELELQESFAGSTYFVKAGTIYTAKQDPEYEVCLSPVDPMVSSLLYLTRKQAKLYFTTPTKDLNSAMEESFMVCEREYC